MIGSLSSKEYQDLIAKKKKVSEPAQADVYESGKEQDSLDEGETHWDTELA